MAIPIPISKETKEIMGSLARFFGHLSGLSSEEIQRRAEALVDEAREVAEKRPHDAESIRAALYRFEQRLQELRAKRGE